MKVDFIVPGRILKLTTETPGDLVMVGRLSVKLKTAVRDAEGKHLHGQMEMECPVAEILKLAAQ